MRSNLVSFRAVVGGVCAGCLVCVAGALTGCKAGGPPPDMGAANYQTGHALGELVGKWNVSGWMADDAGGRRTLTGRALGAREKNFFVRLDMTCAETGAAAPVEGTCLFAQRGGQDVELSSWSSSSPTMRRFEGKMSADEREISFNEQPGGEGRSMKVVLNSPLGWDVEVWMEGKQIESYSFRKAGN